MMIDFESEAFGVVTRKMGGHCKDCKHFEAFDGSDCADYGECHRLGVRASPLISLGPDDLQPIRVLPMFGCIEFETKPDDSHA
ncbi:MAG: hypothetical protein ACJ71S_06155 [Acidobacteriaceae bacterium]|jgi:hypothetical protein